MDIDPSRVVRVFEDLFGYRLGRLLATLALAAATLFLLLWCAHGIWEYGGKAAFRAFVGLSIPGISGANVSELMSVFMLILALYGAIVVAILFFFGRALFKKNVSQAALDRLAELRNEGIDTVWAIFVKSDDQFAAWKITKKAWETTLRKHIEENFPKSDFLYASHLGVVHQLGGIDQAFNAEHLRELWFVTRQMDIVEQILNSYRR